MQTLFGLNEAGLVRHTEPVGSLSLLQLLNLARARSWHFARVEIWEEAVCVLRIPPLSGAEAPLADRPAAT